MSKVSSTTTSFGGPDWVGVCVKAAVLLDPEVDERTDGAAGVDGLVRGSREGVVEVTPPPVLLFVLDCLSLWVLLV